MGTVYWITGLSGAGKTTIGRLFYEKLKRDFPNTVFLDGDILREVFGADLGYTEMERRKCAMRYARLCDMLQRQDLNVVCCTISMFEAVREWNRRHIDSYKEIYVKVSMDTLCRRDQKGLYSGNTEEKEKEVTGIQIPFEEPRNSDLVLENDGELTPQEQVEKMTEHFIRGNQS
jgi:adenylylsulfate kinase